ncbi:SIMPL domain-containing protein (plasmid) [Borreliella burgdorferi]|nr:SIMPL domain-containing protein [Borreliella burgdorferi]WNY59816.1 SIMPL domain-containing protein [Borreliella burgdorferi]WNY61516.1 SIMPL domain-containing protein [Borreliella burgdorferi]
MFRGKEISFLLFSLLLFISSIIISHGIKNIGTKNENYITVKGLSEREILSTSSSWEFRYSLTGDTINDINKANNLSLSKIKTFFLKHGFSEDHIKMGFMEFNEENYKESLYKYRAYISLTVHTKNIEKMEAVEKNIAELYNQGILISNSGGPRYYFDNINDIKPEMLADSIKNAKLAALEFAKHSSSKLGKIKNANQGYFEFLPIDRSLGAQERYPKKNIKNCYNRFLLFGLILG